ncbi:trypsin-like [Leptidea sinapis]|uniref:trypsin n=1 Tax=Leptidea sinapis TaxID=189913 RepID=A0A5E4PNZ8_9NEOP|nr:trypsin-like [Leptidea sinapis]VVC87553.1 unnamed protein product [Leptidea sinapis]
MLLVQVVFCTVLYMFSSECLEYHGRLSRACVQEYYNMFITRQIPLRTYKYYHEDLVPEAFDYNLLAPQELSFGWRIVGGKLVDITDVPFQVLYGRYCGGTLLAPNWVLTAAHCGERDNLVFAGSTQSSIALGYPICSHFTHPLWNNSGLHKHDFDYQLLLLERPIPVSANARPIAIGSPQDIQTGLMIGVSGWGHLQYKKSRMQDVLRRVYVPIMSAEECKTMPDGNYGNITPRMFCAGYINGTKDSCQGDSGGPAVLNGKLVGIVSYGVRCAEARHPGVYSNVPLARDWIRAITGLPL